MYSPHVAPALASRMSTWSVCFFTSASSCCAGRGSSYRRGREIARAPGARFGSALRVLTAESQAAFLRDEMKTVDAPAWRRLLPRAGQLFDLEQYET